MSLNVNDFKVLFIIRFKPIIIKKPYLTLFCNKINHFTTYLGVKSSFMKKISTLLFIFLFSTIIFAQKTISGKVLDDEGKPLPSASVTIEEVGKNTILNYAITDAKGTYKVTYNSDDAQIVVKVKAFNHKTILSQYPNATQSLNFTLEGQATEIKEVKLKTKLITKRGDTISYDLKSFENKSDRTLSDVLKKIPGIEVNKDGSILYQGEPINKFYVNGKDLMEGSYGLINNSLPKDAVQKVEVMENHQPVKILQDKLASENAAINVKLKKAITMTGRGEISEGIAPYLWNVKLSPMLFTQKVQWVLNYKTNNTGDEVEKENSIMAFGNRFEGVRRNFSENSWLNVENASTPSNVPVKRYLFNNVHYLSANLLTNLTKDWEFKANTSYTNNAIDRESVSTVYTQNGTLVNTSSVANNFYTNQAKGEIIFSKNANKSFFKNTTTYNGLWNTDVAQTTNKANTSLNSAQRSKTPSNNFQNSLSVIIPWKEKLVNAMSFVSYRDDKQDLYINPASYVNSLNNVITGTGLAHQYLNLKTFEANHSASVGFTKNSWTITPEVGLNFVSNKLITDLNGEVGGTIENPGSAYENNLKFQSMTPYAQMMVNFKKGNFEANIAAPANFNNITAQDNANLNKSLHKVTYEPRLFARYDLTSFWKISGFTGLSNNFGSVNDIFAGKILLSSKNLSTKDTDIQQTQMKFAGSRLEYRNPLNNIFFNLSYNLSDRTSNITYLNLLNASTQQITVKGYNLENKTQSNSWRTELGKYFPKFKTNASVGYSNSLGKSQQLPSNLTTTPTANDFQSVKSNSQGVTAKFNNNYFSWLSVDYNATWSFVDTSVQTTSGQVKNKSQNFNHALSAYVYPVKNHTLGFTWDELKFKNGDQSRTNSFYDLSYQYSMVEEKMDIELKLVNIANTSTYQDVSFNATTNQTTYRTINIRPRQVVLTLKFNFK